MEGSATQGETPELGRLGPYELVRELGRGGMGVVYLARQEGLDRLVALKVLSHGAFASADNRARFRREALTMASIHHPGIVSVIETGEEQGLAYLAMEYVEGEDLAAWARRERPEARRLARTFADLARAVAHLHARGLVHRDLKPANILVGADGRPRVTDFGLARGLVESDSLSRTGDLLGSIAYLSPEQARGTPSEIGPPTDVHALGAVLYELLTGAPPFAAKDPMDVIARVLWGEPRPLRQLAPEVPRDLDRICLKCLERAPERRYRDAAELAEDLERFAAGEPVRASSSGVFEELLRACRRRPALSARLAGILVFAVVTLTNTFVLHEEDAAFAARTAVVLGIWIAVSVLAQRAIERGRHAHAVRTFWTVADAALLTSALLVADGVASPLLPVYALWIASSGLWFRPRVVLFAAGLSGLSYAVLIADSLWWRPALARPPGDHLVLLAALLLLGWVVAFLVRRTLALGRHAGRLVEG